MYLFVRVFVPTPRTPIVSSAPSAAAVFAFRCVKYSCDADSIDGTIEVSSAGISSRIAWGGNVNTIAEFTVPEKILLAGFQLEEQGQSPFSAEALIVVSWQKFPRTFGLKGYDEQYPDSNKVLASIMGEKGLARRGWLLKMGQKLYSLSPDGRQAVRRLLDGDAPLKPVRSDRPIKLSKEYDKLMQGLFETSAYEKIREGRQPELTFADACRFWSITENLSGDALDARLDHLRAVLAEVERQIGPGSANLGDGHNINADDLTQMVAIHKHLSERFGRHLTLLRNRVVRP